MADCAAGAAISRTGRTAATHAILRANAPRLERRSNRARLESVTIASPPILPAGL
jgi:hypothetical protein